MVRTTNSFVQNISHLRFLALTPCATKRAGLTLFSDDYDDCVYISSVKPGSSAHSAICTPAPESLEVGDPIDETRIEHGMRLLFVNDEVAPQV